jgi:hypothetical protein
LSPRLRVPAADDLFRPTAVPGPGAATRPDRTTSGRVKHDEKVTVYLTSEELLDIEHARLALRRLGVGVDRGRLIRQAVALALADLDEHGEDSALARRLTRS